VSERYLIFASRVAYVIVVSANGEGYRGGTSMVGIKEFLVNASVLVSIIYVSSLLHKYTLTNLDPRIKQILFIVMSIFAGWCSMFFGIHLSDSVIFDLRFIPVIISVLFSGSAISIFLIASGIGFARLYFGISAAAMAGLINLVILGLVGVILFYTLRNTNFIKKMLVSVIIINVFNVINIAVWGVIPAVTYLYGIVPIALPASIVFSVLLIWMIKDLQSEFFNKMDLLNKANKDPLTQLYNKRAFQLIFNKLIYLPDRSSYPIAAAFIDIDNFKQVNDTYGHLKADIVLQRVGQRISSIVRYTDIVARYGGDEFVIIMSNCNKEMATSRMEELRRQFEVEAIVINNQEVFVTLSIGVTVSPPIDVKKILEVADRAVYQAKKDGRNKVVSIS